MKSIDYLSNEPLNASVPKTGRTGSIKPKRGSKGKLGGKAKKKPSISKLKIKLWKIVADRIKARDKGVCYTSGKIVSGTNAHCGHGMPNSICGARLRYHPKNLHCQSYYENIHASGNGVQYYQNQVRDYGQTRVNELYALKNKYIKADIIFYMTLIDLYTNASWEEIEDFLES